MNTQDANRRTYNQGHTRKMVLQKLYGLAMIAMCIMIMSIAYSGEVVEGRDVTSVILFAPMGFYLLATKNIVIY